MPNPVYCYAFTFSGKAQVKIRPFAEESETGTSEAQTSESSQDSAPKKILIAEGEIEWFIVAYLNQLSKVIADKIAEKIQEKIVADFPSRDAIVDVSLNFRQANTFLLEGAIAIRTLLEPLAIYMGKKLLETVEEKAIEALENLITISITQAFQETLNLANSILDTEEIIQNDSTTNRYSLNQTIQNQRLARRIESFEILDLNVWSSSFSPVDIPENRTVNSSPADATQSPMPPSSLTSHDQAPQNTQIGNSLLSTSRGDVSTDLFRPENLKILSNFSLRLGFFAGLISGVVVVVGVILYGFIFEKIQESEETTQDFPFEDRQSLFLDTRSG